MHTQETQERKIATIDSIFLGIGGTSPALSIAAAAAALLSTAGNLAPASILYSGLMIFGITLSFIHLNKLKVDDGASFTWVTEIFGKALGFLSGWAVLVASVIYLVSAAPPAATGILSVINPAFAENKTLITILGVAILSLINFIVLRGLRFASKIETFVTSLSLVTMLSIIIAAAYHLFVFKSGTLPEFPFLISSFTRESFVSSTLIALFFFWGWDVAMNVGEETSTANNGITKSVSAVMIVVAALTMLSMMAIYSTLSPEQIAASGTNVVFDVANMLFPKPLGTIAVVTILLSSIGAIEASILQFIKTLFSMSRAGALHKRYQKIYAKWNSPWLAILIIWSVSTALFIFSVHSHSAAYVVKAAINATVLQVAFYYSMTGFACAWHYRKSLWNVRDLLLKILWPLISALFLVSVSLYSINTLDKTTIAIGFGGLFLGIIPFIINLIKNQRITNKHLA